MKNLKFKCNDKTIIHGEKTHLCAIVNATPDSFSDGGKYDSTEKALARALKMISDGADIIDIGGESTRPGSTPVSADEEIRRVVPVIKALRSKSDVIISVDTWKAKVAEAAISAGADIINDITGLLGDSNMANVIGKKNAGAVLMFNPVIARPYHDGSKIFPKFGENQFIQDEYDAMANADIMNVMAKFFEKSLQRAHDAGIPDERIMLDPGIGFGLTKRENLLLIKNVDVIHQMGYMSFLGVSRKRFIVNIIDEYGFDTDPSSDTGFANRDSAGASLSAVAAFCGVDVLRVHTVRKHLMASAIGDNIRSAEQKEDTNFGAYKNK